VGGKRATRGASKQFEGLSLSQTVAGKPPMISQLFAGS
jgi:hypothetical protein